MFVDSRDFKPIEFVGKLDPDGLYRWQEIYKIVPVSKSCWWEFIKLGKAPKPIKLGSRTTLWRGSQILNWIKDPTGATNESQ